MKLSKSYKNKLVCEGLKSEKQTKTPDQRERLELDYSWRVDLTEGRGVLLFSQYRQKIMFLAFGKLKEFTVSGLNLLWNVKSLIKWNGAVI